MHVLTALKQMVPQTSRQKRNVMKQRLLEMKKQDALVAQKKRGESNV